MPLNASPPSRSPKERGRAILHELALEPTSLSVHMPVPVSEGGPGGETTEPGRRGHRLRQVLWCLQRHDTGIIRIRYPAIVWNTDLQLASGSVVRIL